MAKGQYLLGIDIGGTGVKAGVFCLDGVLEGEGYGEYPMVSSVPGQAEHDAEKESGAFYEDRNVVVDGNLVSYREEAIVPSPF